MKKYDMELFDNNPNLDRMNPDETKLTMYLNKLGSPV